MTVDDLNDTGVKALCAAILIQSTKDYFKVREVHDQNGIKCPPTTGEKELARFFESEWGRRLFGLFGLNVQAALKAMDEQYKNGTYKNNLKRTDHKPEKEPVFIEGGNGVGIPV